MNATANLMGAHLQVFFTEHLCQHKRVSPRTLACYRDTFRLLLQFIKDRTGIEPATLQVSDVDATTVLAFLDYLEQQRGNATRSRNLRLAAIRSFFRLVALRDPNSVALVTRILAIPVKRAEKTLIGYLTREEVDALLAAPDRKTWKGRRDHALLLTLYNSGARVSEITGLQRHQVHFGGSAFLQLKGKGRKERVIPLWPHTRRVLRDWFEELGGTDDLIAFPSARGRTLSRDGVDYILQGAIHAAGARCPSLTARKITPHVIRHATAMHLLQAGVDMASIALWLGHESLETTHVYLQTDLMVKEQALEKLNPVKGTTTRFKAGDPLMAFLASL
jgi:site-specific recombinase XerD